MFRSLAALTVTLAAVSNHAFPPLHAGAGTKAEPAESRQKIIDQVKTDLNQVRDRLNADDPGAEMRAGQDRILKGFDDLLKQKDPNQSKSPPPSGSPPPMRSGKPTPDPKPAADQPTPMPAPPQANPRPEEIKPKPAAGKGVTLPNTPDEVRKESTIDGPWRPLPPRHRVAMDAVGRDRFVPNYQEILREYYRNLAQSSRAYND